MIRYLLVGMLGLTCLFACGKKKDKDSSSATEKNKNVGKLALECDGKTCIGTGE